MSTEVDDRAQLLSPRQCDVCNRCGNRVYFRQIASRILGGDGSRRVVYLRCPSCGAKATRIDEVESEVLIPISPKRTKKRYVLKR